MAENGNDFNPSDHLTDIQGKQYLEVKWRLVWLRAEHPDAHLVTKCEEVTPTSALFVASIGIPGGGSATGYGSETQDDFGDFIEKAETKAIGRALAALGYGTQFCDDFDEGGAVTDAPVQRRQRPDTAAADDATAAEARRQYEKTQGVPPPEPDAQPDQPENPPCLECGEITSYKSGTSKAGKDWKGYFCSNRDHEPIWIRD